MYPAGKLAYAQKLHFTEDADGSAEVSSCITQVAETRNKIVHGIDVTSVIAGLGLGALALTGVGLSFAIGKRSLCCLATYT